MKVLVFTFLPYQGQYPSKACNSKVINRFKKSLSAGCLIMSNNQLLLYVDEKSTIISNYEMKALPLFNMLYVSMIGGNVFYAFVAWTPYLRVKCAGNHPSKH